MAEPNSQTEDEQYQNEIDELEAKIEALQNHELSDEAAQRIANRTGQKDPHDLHERKAVPVTVKNGNVDVGNVYTIAGNEQINWKDTVVGTFGAGPETTDGIRQSYQESKTRWIRGLKEQRNRYLNARRMDVPVWDAPPTHPDN